MKKGCGPVYEKHSLLYHSSAKGEPASPEKCALFFLAVSACALLRAWPPAPRGLHHGADRVEVGVEADGLPLGRLGARVVHGVLERRLAVVVFVNRAACVLRFGCSPVDENTG